MVRQHANRFAVILDLARDRAPVGQPDRRDQKLGPAGIGLARSDDFDFVVVVFRHREYPAKLQPHHRVTSVTPTATSAAAMPFCIRSRPDKFSRPSLGHNRLKATPKANTNSVVVEPIA